MGHRKAALLALALTACTPEQVDTEGTDETETSSSTEGTESTDTGDSSWGIVLDVGPDHYGTETG